MKIELEEPFSSIYHTGYLVTNPENRRNVLLVGSMYRTTISYARYLMSIKMKAFISREFEVDHIDDDKTNDTIENLQLLTKAQNRAKEVKRYIDKVQVKHKCICCHCNKEFIISDRYMNMKIKQKNKNIFCNKDCFKKYIKLNHTNNRFNILNNDSIFKIKELRQKGLSSYKISEQTGFARNTIMKYW